MPAASSPVDPRPGCPCKTWAKSLVSGKNSLHALTRTIHGRRTTKQGGGARRLIQSDSLIQSEPLLGWVLAASPGGEKPGDTASTRGLAPLSKARFASTASETRSGTGYTQAQEGVHPDSVLPLMGHAEYLRSAHWPQGSTWAAGSFPVGNQEVPLIRQAGMGVTNSSPLQVAAMASSSSL